MEVPRIEGPKADELLAKLHPGSSVSNPIDFLATGNARQLGEILDYVDTEYDEIDGAVVVFGTTGMWRVDDVYQVLHEKINISRKPIFPILPSAIQAAEEVSHFHTMGHVNFTDEVSFGYVLSRVNKLQPPYPEAQLPPVNANLIRQVMVRNAAGYLPPEEVNALLQAAGIATARQATVHSEAEAIVVAKELGFPLVMKVVGPVHKSDIGGVVLGIQNEQEVADNYRQLMTLAGAEAVLLQQQRSGIEVYMGAKAEPPFGKLILCGLGGIFVEVFKDVSAALSPVHSKEAARMIRRLRSYPIIQGVRGKSGVSEELLVQTILKLSALLEVAPEISEMDINPLLGSKEELEAVDARILIER